MLARSMADMDLEAVIRRAPNGLPLAIGCWVAARAATLIAASPRAITPAQLRVTDDGAIRASPRAAPRVFAYTAPEVIRGEPPSERSAVFSLGCLLVECVTGRSPFQRETDLETRIAVAEDVVPALSESHPDATRELDALVARALEKDPDARLGSPLEFAAHVDAFLVDELFDVGSAQLAAVVGALIEGRDPHVALKRASSSALPPRQRPMGEPKLAIPAKRPETGPFRLPSNDEFDSFDDSPVPVPSTPVPSTPRPPPPAAKPNDAWSEAELDLQPPPSRRSNPAKPRLGTELAEVELAPTRKAPKSNMPALDIDARALAEERARPRTEPVVTPPEPGPNWVLRIAAVLLGLLALAVVWQFLLRPLWKD